MEQQRQEMPGRICPRGASYYLWKENDTLTSVAQANSTTAQALTVINPDVNFQTLTPGTEICMPSRSLTCISGQPYTVQSGETFYTIAQKLGISDLELRERNPDVSPARLSAGQVICIPASEQSSGPVLDGTAQDNNTVPPQPIAPVRPTVVCPAGYAAQRVRAGQSYADLLIDLNVSYKAMRAANPTLRPAYMVAGTPYCVPPAGAREACSPRSSYTIQEGDTLASIARRLNTTAGRLLMLNATLLPTDFSQPGVVICIP